MSVAWLILAGVVGGMLGGMGLGGGTLLMPILTFALDIPPRLAAWTNLVCFLPAAVIALIVHTRNGLIDGRAALFLTVFAVVGATGVFLFAGNLSDHALKRAFGLFLIVLGSLSLFLLLFGFSKKK